MNASIFLRSFLSNQFSGSKFLTSAAIFAVNSVVSKRVIAVTPLRPSQSAFQFSSVPVASAVTRPTPVTTTRLFCKIRPLLRFWHVRFDVTDRFLDRRNLFGVFVRNFHAESFFQSHHQFDRIQRIRAEVVAEGGGGWHFGLVHAQLLNDDLFNLVFN